MRRSPVRIRPAAPSQSSRNAIEAPSSGASAFPASPIRAVQWVRGFRRAAFRELRTGVERLQAGAIVVEEAVGRPASSDRRIAAALVTSAVFHLGILAVPSGDRLADVDATGSTVHLAAMLVPTATVHRPTSESAFEQPPPRSRDALDRASVPSRRDAFPDATLPPPPPPPEAAPWLDPSELDAQPIPTSRPQPEYPPVAEHDRLEGIVTFHLYIDELGVVRQAQVIASPHDGVFDRAATRAVKALRFVPAEKDARFVRARIPYSVTFSRVAKAP